MIPAHAGDILSQLTPAVDTCRAMLLERPQSRTWLKDTPDGRRESVSELDLAVQEELSAAVRAIVPSASIFSEEGARDPSALDDDLCFVIDPVDGTDLLIAGQTGFAISVAILSSRRVLAGLLDFPAQSRRFVCTVGSGTTLNDQPIRVRATSALTSARIAISSTQRAIRNLDPLWSNLGVAELIPTPGFTAKLATILVGDCDAALYLPIKARPTFIWDYAAAALLLQEAGGRLTTLDGHAFLQRMPIEHRDGWLAATDNLHESLQAAVVDALGMLPGID